MVAEPASESGLKWTRSVGPPEPDFLIGNAAVPKWADSDLGVFSDYAFFTSHRAQLAILTAEHKIPAAYARRAYVAAGGLMSLRGQLRRLVSPSRRLYGPHPQGCQARRPPGRAADQVRIRHQP